MWKVREKLSVAEESWRGVTTARPFFSPWEGRDWDTIGNVVLGKREPLTKHARLLLPGCTGVLTATSTCIHSRIGTADGILTSLTVTPRTRPTPTQTRVLVFSYTLKCTRFLHPPTWKGEQNSAGSLCNSIQPCGLVKTGTLDSTGTHLEDRTDQSFRR